jgi:hypothetical protein
MENNIEDIYFNKGVEAPMKSEISGFSYTPKEKGIPLPENAKILKKDKSIRVNEIDNGYLVYTQIVIAYRCEDDEDVEYHYPPTSCVYQKEKPSEVAIIYELNK